MRESLPPLSSSVFPLPFRFRHAPVLDGTLQGEDRLSKGRAGDKSVCSRTMETGPRGTGLPMAL